MYTLYSLTSELHSEPVAEPADERFIQDIEKALGEAFEFGSTDFSARSFSLDVRDHIPWRV